LKRTRFMTIKMIGLTSRARLQHVLDDLASHNDLVLDAGCGSGEFVISLLLGGFAVIGLDRDIRQLRDLSAAARRMGEHCNLVAADVSQLPFRDSSFEAVYCMEVINMLEKDDDALREFVRVLERDGTCTVTAPYEGYPIIYDPLNRFLEKRRLHHRQLGIWSPGVKRLYRPSKLLLKLRSLGLTPIGLNYIGKWLIPALENYISLLLYYKVLASRFRTRFASSSRNRDVSAVLSAVSKVLDCIIRLDSVPNIYGTHFIIKARKF